MEERMAYNEQNANRIYRRLENATKQGSPIEYEIRIDSFVSVHRTTDLELFDWHESDLDENSEKITFLLYRGKSQHSDRFELIKTPTASLFGLQTKEERIETSIAAFRKEQEEQERERKLHKLRRKVKKLKRILHTQDSLITELQTKQSFDFKELVPLLQSIRPAMGMESVPNEATLAGIPVSTLLPEFEKAEKQYGRERIVESMMIMLDILPSKSLIKKVKELIKNHG